MRTLTVALLLPLCVLTGCDGSDDDETFSFEVPSESMEPTLPRGEDVTATVVDDYEPNRGDIVVFPDPGGWLSEEYAGGDLIKRVIGLPGDRITCCNADGLLAIDGVPVAESYIADAGQCALPNTLCSMDEVTVPAGMLFVLGDNRMNSADSSAYVMSRAEDRTEPSRAFVPVDSVRGVVR